MKKTLFENFSWTFIGSALYAFSQWLLIIILAKLGSVEVVGLFSLGLAITAPIILFFNMQMRNIVATDVLGDYSFSTYYSQRINLHIISAALLVLLVLIISDKQEIRLVILLIGVSKIIESLSELTHGYFQKIERMDIAGKSLILKAISTVILFFLIYNTSKSLVWSMLGINIVWIIRLLYYDIKNVKKMEEVKYSFGYNKKLIMYVLPLGFVSIINSLNTNIPRYVLESSGGLEKLGYFSAMIYLIIAGRLLVNPLSLVITPRLASSYKKGQVKKFKNSLLNLVIISLISGMIIVAIVNFFGEQILSIVYQSDYARYNNEFLVIVIGAIFSYITIFINASIVATGKFKRQPLINFIVLIIGLIASFFLIPTHGILGASIVTLIIFFVQLLLSSILLFFILKERDELNDTKS